jgi:hypothetical protein
VVSTPTTFPERRRPSRVMSVLRTTSALVVSTSGRTRAIASASRTVSPGEYRLGSFAPSSFASSSFCFTIGVMTMLLEPNRRICSRISCSAPFPIASIAMTDATPKRMPSDVSPARSLLCPTASIAVRMLKAACAVSCWRASRQVGKPSGTGAIPFWQPAPPGAAVQRR